MSDDQAQKNKRRFQHHWYQSGVLRAEDNISFDDMKRGAGIPGRVDPGITIEMAGNMLAMPPSKPKT